MSTLCIKHMPCNFVPTRNDFHNKSQAFIDASQVEGTLILRPVAVGDRFRPFGMKNGTKLVSDFLTDRKVNLLDKQSQLVVIDTGNNNIVWICGREIDNRYSVTSQSTNILRITLTSADVR
jgi:tRNA(Ile)-lysidine synthase